MASPAASGVMLIHVKEPAERRELWKCAWLCLDIVPQYIAALSVYLVPV